MENDREPMDSLIDGTASLLRRDNCRWHITSPQLLTVIWL